MVVPAASGNVIALVRRADGLPLLTIAPPAAWRSSFEDGEDTRRHYLSGYGVDMTIEFWATNPGYACASPGCSRGTIVADGVTGTLWRSPASGSVRAFIPRRDPVGRLGVRVAASCATPDGCRLAERVIATIRGL